MAEKMPVITEDWTIRSSMRKSVLRLAKSSGPAIEDLSKDAAP